MDADRGLRILGPAVGTDIFTSLALVSEISPAESRAKLMGLGNVFWYIGPLVTLSPALLVQQMELGLLGVRIVFVHLAVVAGITYYLRRGPENTTATARISTFGCGEVRVRGTEEVIWNGGT